MRVHNNVLVVVIIEKLIPETCIKMESIMEDKLQPRLLILNHFADIPIELHQHVQVR